MADKGNRSDFNILIPQLATWKNGEGTDVDTWLVNVGSYEHAVAYANLFWPEFTVHDDCVLVAGFNETIFDGFMEQTGGNRRAVEQVMNHRHILDLFQKPDQAPSEEIIVHLGRVLKDMWSCKLRHDFPSRTIVVSFTENDVEDLLDYEITFYQMRGPDNAR